MADEGPQVGEPAPDFDLASSHGERVKLSNLQGESSVLLIFYPGDFTPICTRQLCSYSNAYQEFEKRGFRILGIGVDSVETHKKFIREKNISFPLLSDPAGQTCQDYGVYGSIMKKPQRAIFLIDKDGRVKFRHVEPTRLLYKKADAVLELLERALEGKTT